MALGDRLVLFTDGVTEEFDESDEIFSDERLLGLVPQAGASASELTQYVLRATHDFAGGRGQSDDITVVALGLLAAEAAEPLSPIDTVPAA